MKELLKTIIKESQEQVYSDVKSRNLNIPLTESVIITLTGPRRSGKTYLLKGCVNRLLDLGISRENIVYLNFEDERIDIAKFEPDLILQSFFELYPDSKSDDCFFFFDEIQNISGWERFVRRVYDTVTKHIFITGSNAKLLSTEIATSLRGRTISYNILPLSFSEYLQFRDFKPDFYNSRKLAELRTYTKQFINDGGFPDTIEIEQNIKIKLLQSYFNTMIYRDIVERYKISDPLLLKYFIKKIFATIGKPLSVNKIYNDLRSMGYKISNNYLYTFLEYCNTIFLSIPIPKFSFSEIKQEKSDKKIYCIDTGLLASVEFSMSENRGKMLENMVLLEFMKSNKTVFYYKEKYECDFIIENQKALLPVQVTYSLKEEQTRVRELRGIAEACKAVKSNEALIITFEETEEIVFQKVKIRVVPVYEYFFNYL